MHICFSTDYTVRAQGGETYRKGKVYDMSLASCMHFISKGVAAEEKGGRPPVPETASVAPSETAVRPRGRPRTVTRDDG